MTNEQPATTLIDDICSINCAAADRDFGERLANARQRLQQQPDLAHADIFMAAACGEVDTVKTILASDSEAADRQGGPRDWTPLLYLCFSRFLRDKQNPVQIQCLLETAQVLLAAGADPNTYFMLGDEKETALYAACGVCNNADLAELLLHYGADVNDEDASYHVSEFNEHDCIRVLFENSLDADRSATVLLRKLDFDDYDGVKAILDCGCDVNHQGFWKKSPLHQAIMRGRDLKTIELLLAYGADLNAKTADGATPWFLACTHGRGDVAGFLLRHEADESLSEVDEFLAVCGMGQSDLAKEMLQEQPNLVAELSDVQRTLIVTAGRTGNRTGLETMLDSGFDIATKDEQGFTALHWAAWYGHLDCVRILIDRGAPLDAVNNYGGTVLNSTVWGYANSNGNDRYCRKILLLLAEFGGDPRSVSPFPSGHAESDQVIQELLDRGNA